MEKSINLNGVKIAGIGAFLPKRVVSNQELCDEMLNGAHIYAKIHGYTGQKLEDFIKNASSDSNWIIEHTGIEERRFAGTDEATSDLAAPAVLEAAECAGIKPEEIQGLYCSTVTPDELYSSPTYIHIAKKIGIIPGATFFGADISSACTSFIAGLSALYSKLATGIGGYTNGMIAGTDKMSSTTNPYDRRIRPILADAAGALFCTKCHISESSFKPNWFHEIIDWQGIKRICTIAGGSARGLDKEGLENFLHMLAMMGPKVYTDIMKMLFPKDQYGTGSFIRQALEKAELDIKKDIDLILMHQANLRMITGITERLEKTVGFDPNKIYNNIQLYGNTTSASIPLLLYECHKKGILQKGMKILLLTFGGGYNGKSAIIEWTL